MLEYIRTNQNYKTINSKFSDEWQGDRRLLEYHVCLEKKKTQYICCDLEMVWVEKEKHNTFAVGLEMVWGVRENLNVKLQIYQKNYREMWSLVSRKKSNIQHRFCCSYS